jgi:hypothetical protein
MLKHGQRLQGLTGASRGRALHPARGAPADPDDRAQLRRLRNGSGRAQFRARPLRKGGPPRRAASPPRRPSRPTRAFFLPEISRGASSARPAPPVNRGPAGAEGCACTRSWARQRCLGRTMFHHIALLHHDDLVAERAHHLQVVADEQIGQPVRLPAGRAAARRSAPAPSCRAPRSARPAPPAWAAGSWRARWRCAGAGRRRTRAGSGPSWPDRARPRHASATSSRAVPRRDAMHARPSAMICSQVMRGLRLPYGSWNTICMSRRSGRIAATSPECRAP